MQQLQPLVETIGLDHLDIDGALREAEEAVAGDSRADFFRKAGVLGGSVIGGGALMGALPSLASAGGVAKSDVAILNFALTLEYLESEFYKAGLKRAGLHGRELQLFQLINSHEAVHVKFLKKALGSAAIKKPKFNFGGTTHQRRRFLATSFVLENTGVKAYSGQAGNIKSKKILGAAASILTIEARHAAAVAEIIGPIKGKNGVTPNGAFDVARSKSQILKAVKATKFIVG